MKRKDRAAPVRAAQTKELDKRTLPRGAPAVKASAVRAQTFERLARDRRLDHGAVRLFLVLFTYQNKLTGRCFPSQPTLARDMGCSINSIAPWTQQLVKSGYLTAQVIGRRLYYRLHFEPSNTEAEPSPTPKGRNQPDSEIVKRVLKVVHKRHPDADEEEAQRVVNTLAKGRWMKRNGKTGKREPIYGGDAGKAAVVIGALKEIEGKREGLSD